MCGRWLRGHVGWDGGSRFCWEPVCSQTFCPLGVLHLLLLCLRMPILGQVPDLTPPALWPTSTLLPFLYLLKESSFQRTTGKEVRQGRAGDGTLKAFPVPPLPFKIVIKITSVINEKPIWCRKPSLPPHLSSLQMYPYVCLILVVPVVSSTSLSNTLYFYILIY